MLHFIHVKSGSLLLDKPESKRGAAKKARLCCGSWWHISQRPHPSPPHNAGVQDN